MHCNHNFPAIYFPLGLNFISLTILTSTSSASPSTKIHSCKYCKACFWIFSMLVESQASFGSTNSLTLLIVIKPSLFFQKNLFSNSEHADENQTSVSNKCNRSTRKLAFKKCLKWALRLDVCREIPKESFERYFLKEAESKF